MINEDIRHIIEPELRDGEELLWLEEIELKPIFLANIFKDLIPFVILNLGIGGLYFSGLGGFSSQTIIALLVAGNCGAIAIFLYETSWSHRATKSRVLHAVTSKRIIALAWKKDEATRISQIQLKHLSHYSVKNRGKDIKILFFECSQTKKPKAKFQIQTYRNALDFETIISPLLKRITS